MTELIHDPQEINKLAEAFQKVSEDTEITTAPPASTVVNLPGGYLFSNGTIGTTAEIRELNGFDEEAIAKASSVEHALTVILERGLVSIGNETLSKSDLDTLLLGDRDAILLAIRKITFGTTVEFSIVCQSCAKQQVSVVDLDNDVETKTLNDPVADRLISVEIKSGEAQVTLPNMITGKRLADNANKTIAESVTEMLGGCLAAINGIPSMGKATALQLGLLDRETIVNALYENAPGPRLAEVKKTCEACDNDIPLTLSLASLFRLQ